MNYIFDETCSCVTTSQFPRRGAERQVCRFQLHVHMLLRTTSRLQSTVCMCVCIRPGFITGLHRCVCIDQSWKCTVSYKSASVNFKSPNSTFTVIVRKKWRSKLRSIDSYTHVILILILILSNHQLDFRLIVMYPDQGPTSDNANLGHTAILVE